MSKRTHLFNVIYRNFIIRSVVTSTSKTISTNFSKYGHCLSTHWCAVYTSYFEYLKADVCLFWDTLFPRWGNFSPIYLTINSRQIQGICHNLYVIMVINLFVLLSLKFSVTRARIECCVFSILNYININIDCTTGNIGNCQMILSQSESTIFKNV